MKTTRRTMIAGGLIGALAAPAMAGFSKYRWKHGEGIALLHDPSLEAGARFSSAASAADKRAISVEIIGDRVHFMREVLAKNPALIAGVTRHADQMLLADIAREAGYMEVGVFHVNAGRYSGCQCQKGWGSLGRLVEAWGSNWAEALANFAINSGEAILDVPTASWAGAQDSGLVLGWVLAPRV